jgi:heavy metal sensor kinase
MIKSLAWRIQLWHGLTLLAVVAGLGTFLYGRIQRTRYEQIDAELEGAGQVLVSVLHTMPRHELEDGIRPDRPPPGRRPPPPPRGGRGGPGGGPPGDGPPGGGLRGLFGGPPPRGERPPPDDGPPPEEEQQRPDPPLHLPSSLVERYDKEPPYFIIWRANGDVLKSSEKHPDIAWADVPKFRDDTTPIQRRSGDRREIYLPAGHGSAVLVGRTIKAELAELSSWRWLIILSGGGAVVIGVAGGAWLVQRALKPLAQMSKTAATISAENLSARIDTRAIDIELAALANTLNDAFDRLEADFQKQARFAADASHELRTPLTVILGHIELALKQKTDPATREALEASYRAARRMKSLIEQLLLLARADAGKLLPERQNFDFGATVEECVELLSPLARKKNVEIIPRIAGVDISGDPSLLAQVAINLVNNAIAHNRPGGSVTVTVSNDDKNLIFIVADTGPGISAAAQAKLFERFYRADTARSRETGGAGLGLAITQSIVHAHGGSIACTSREGEGSEFIVRLPRGDEPKTPWQAMAKKLEPVAH